jgi:glutathione S-transferase
MLKLFGSYTSPYVRHCRIALLETHTPFELVLADMTVSAQQSPTQRVPYLQDGEVFLADSAAILRYAREKAGQVFCATPERLDKFCLVNTAMDACINLFFIGRDGVDVGSIPYLQRQASRIATTLAELDKSALPNTVPVDDADLRLACFIGWAKFRKQLDFAAYSNLDAFYARMLSYQPFLDTLPPA